MEKRISHSNYIIDVEELPDNGGTRITIFKNSFGLELVMMVSFGVNCDLPETAISELLVIFKELNAQRKAKLWEDEWK